MAEVDSKTRDANDPIKHVVLLLLENRSFDQMLGCFQKDYPDLDGIDPDPNAPARVNRDDQGNEFKQIETRQQQMPVDPRHETVHVLEQIMDNNSGFVRDFANYYGRGASPADRQQIMSYYPHMYLHALHRLARDFTICDRWYASVPGPTWPNRFFALSGTSSGRVDMPDGLKHPDWANVIFYQDQTTVFDRLNEANKSWKVYYFDLPCSLILRHQREIGNLLKYRKVDHFFQDVRKSNLPDFAFIEPKYFGQDQNDDHPPHNIMKAEKLIADVYNAIRSNAEIWNSTLLVVVFDEHGGFYDHASPPIAVPPDDHHEEYSFDRLGIRVPAILVSPWVGRRVEHTQFDHTSLLKYMVNKWSLKPLGERTAEANSIGVAITDQQRPDTLPVIRLSYSELVPPRPDLETANYGDHHLALLVVAKHLSADLKKIGVDILGEVTIPGFWLKVKAWLGKRFIRFGAFLTKDLKTNQAQIEVKLDVTART